MIQFVCDPKASNFLKTAFQHIAMKNSSPPSLRNYARGFMFSEIHHVCFLLLNLIRFRILIFYNF
jgi:hypothetical protein